MIPVIANIGARLAAARRLGLARTLVKAARRTRVLDVAPLRRWDVLHDVRIDRPERMREFLQRYEALAATAAGWVALDFRDQRVLEIGCGPLGGWGPLAIFRGAAAYVGCDPAADPDLLGSRRFADAYLRRVFDDLAAHDSSGAGHDLATFLAGLRERAAYRAERIEALPPDARFDIVLSNSCLEHIEPFPPFVAALVRRLAAGARMLHLVDFSNHRDKASPFHPLYELSPDAYRRRYGPHINLLRPPEIIDAFASHGVAVRCLPLDERLDLVRAADIDPAWTRHIDIPTLAIRAAVLIAACPRAAGESG